MEMRRWGLGMEKVNNEAKPIGLGASFEPSDSGRYSHFPF